MADLKTTTVNAWESTLSSGLASGATTINVTDTTGSPAVPFYAVLDPGIDAKREVVLVDGSKTATTFNLSAVTSRGQDGTSDVAHDSDAVVAIVPVAAMWNDLHDRVDANNTLITSGDAPGHTHSATYEAKVDRTGATAGEVPTLQGDGTLAFAAVSGAPPVWLTAGDFDITGGAAARSVIAGGRWIAWLLDAASDEGMASSWDMPDGWASVNVDLYWTNPSTGTGDVVWTTVLDNAADAGNLATSGPITTVTATAPSQHVLKVTRVGTGKALTATNLMNLRVIRQAADAADTLANDAAFLGVMISKAS